MRSTNNDRDQTPHPANWFLAPLSVLVFLGMLSIIAFWFLVPWWILVWLNSVGANKGISIFAFYVSYFVTAGVIFLVVPKLWKFATSSRNNTDTNNESVPIRRIDFNIGDVVQIIDGPFANFHGVVEQKFEGRDRIMVRLSNSRIELPVELDSRQITKR